MNTTTVYEIRVRGHLDNHWSTGFAPLTMHKNGNGETTLVGPVRDQAELHGLLAKVRNLNVILLSVKRIEPEMPPNERVGDISL